jgi:hypothetical protein
MEPTRSAAADDENAVIRLLMNGADASARLLTKMYRQACRLGWKSTNGR